MCCGFLLKCFGSNKKNDEKVIEPAAAPLDQKPGDFLQGSEVNQPDKGTIDTTNSKESKILIVGPPEEPKPEKAQDRINVILERTANRRYTKSKFSDNTVKNLDQNAP